MSRLTPLLTACPLRPIQQAGDQYAADLIRGLSEELSDPDRAADFLETTHLTKPAADFMRMAIDRVARGRDSTSPSIYQLYSRYGGGKTHSLLLLAAAAAHPQLPYWRSAAEVTPAGAEVIAFSGERHDVAGGAQLDEGGNRARSLAGYLLYQLGGPAALQSFQDGDAILTDPGSDVFRRLIGGAPVVIVIDELVQYISRVNQAAAANSAVSRDGVLTTLSALAAAVADSPRAVLVITTPEDAHNEIRDAFPEESLALIDMLDKVNSQLSRVMHSVAPSGEADLPAILRKRLFHGIDEAAREAAARAYAEVARRNGRDLGGLLSEQSLYDAYPFHPWLLRIITGRLAANRNFQRVRGTLRLLSNTLLEMQTVGSRSALVHPRHVTPRVDRIRDELIGRPGFSQLDPAIETDIIGPNSTAAKTDHPLAEQAAVTMLLGSIAPEASNGLYADEIADALLSPEDDDFGLITGALEQFLSRAIYADDSPQTQRKRFSKDANVMKELLEARDAVRSDTSAMTELLRQVMISAYGSARAGGGQFEVVLFPSRQSNLPDEPDRAALGIVNPDHWNWTDAGGSTNGMNNQDLLDLHRHSGQNNGAAPRQYPNHALLLAAHDANLDRIREDIAAMEAARRLLDDASRPLPQHRREHLEQIRASSEKNATIGVQNKFTHLFSAGNSEQHQWPPESRSHLEHRALESLTDAAGKGQEGVLRALGDRVLRGAGAALSPAAWAALPPIANEQGSTLGDLRAHFARTPDMRIVIDEAAWQAMIRSGVRDEALHVQTPHGETNPNGYDPNWLVWAAGYQPLPPAPPDPPSLPPPPPDEPHVFISGALPGKAAYQAVRRFMDDNGLDWPALISCRVRGTSGGLADQIANVAQGDDAGIAITLGGGNQRLQVRITGAPPSEFKDYARSIERMLKRAQIDMVDVDVSLDADAARRVLERLGERDDANIDVRFQPQQGSPG